MHGTTINEHKMGDPLDWENLNQDFAIFTVFMDSKCLVNLTLFLYDLFILAHSPHISFPYNVVTTCYFPSLLHNLTWFSWRCHVLSHALNVLELVTYDEDYEPPGEDLWLSSATHGVGCTFQVSTASLSTRYCSVHQFMWLFDKQVQITQLPSNCMTDCWK